MKSRCIVLMIVFGLLVTTSAARAVTIDWSPVGNPGNPVDPTGPYEPSKGYLGKVNYNYNISTYEVTNSQYAEFLNSNDPTGANTLELYKSNMSTDPNNPGINYNAGAANGSKYSAIPGKENRPVTFVTFFSAARFANWLNNGQAPGSTETGAYTLLGGTPTPSTWITIPRSPYATVFLPNIDEWYKAAYYDPATGNYFTYPTSSNAVPSTGPTPGATPNTANYFTGPNHLTDVGAYSGTTSPSGAYDMGGNVWEWTEGSVSGAYRRTRGGSLYSTVTALQKSSADLVFPNQAPNDVGFRVASVPEPSTAVLAGIGALALMACARRRSAR